MATAIAILGLLLALLVAADIRAKLINRAEIEQPGSQGLLVRFQTVLVIAGAVVAALIARDLTFSLIALAAIALMGVWARRYS